MHVLVCAYLAVDWVYMRAWVCDPGCGLCFCLSMCASFITGMNSVFCTSSPLSAVSSVSWSVFPVTPQEIFVDIFSVALPEMSAHSALCIVLRSLYSYAL